MDDDIGVAWLVKRLVVSKILKSRLAPELADVDQTLTEANTAGRLVWSSMVPDFVRRIVGRGTLENEMAVEYAHRLGTDLDEVSSKALKEGYTASLNRGIDKGLSWARVAEAWGLDGRQMRTFIGSIPDSGYSTEVIPRRSRAQLETMINMRADRIKTNEAYAIGQIAQQIQWIKMRQTGEVGPDVAKQWHTARDELVCSVCGPINNKIVGVTEAFSKGVFAPPVHPNCRCWVELRDSTIVTKRDYKRDQDGKFASVNTLSYQPYQTPNKTFKHHVEQKLISDGGVSSRYYWVREIEHKLANADLEKIKSDPNFDPTIPQIWDLKEQKIIRMPAGLPESLPTTAKAKTLTKPLPLTSVQPEPVVTNVEHKPYERPASLMDPTVKWLRENNIVLKALTMAVERDYKRDEEGKFARVNTLVSGGNDNKISTLVGVQDRPPQPSRPIPVKTGPEYAVDEETLKQIRARTAQIPQRQVLLTPKDVRDIQRIVDGKKVRLTAKPQSLAEFTESSRPKKATFAQQQKPNKIIAKKAEEVSQIIWDSKVAAGKQPKQKRLPRYVVLTDERTPDRKPLSVAVKPVLIEDVPMVTFVDTLPAPGEVIELDDLAVVVNPAKHDISAMYQPGKTAVVLHNVTMHPIARKKDNIVLMDMSQGVVSGQYLATKVGVANDIAGEDVPVAAGGAIDIGGVFSGGGASGGENAGPVSPLPNLSPQEIQEIKDNQFFDYDKAKRDRKKDKDAAKTKLKGKTAKEGEDWDVNRMADAFLADHNVDPREFYLLDEESPFKPPRRI